MEIRETEISPEKSGWQDFTNWKHHLSLSPSQGIDSDGGDGDYDMMTIVTILALPFIESLLCAGSCIECFLHYLI